MQNSKNARLWLPSRRTVLKGSATALAAGTLAPLTLPRPVRAAEDSRVGTNCLSILYQNGEGITFDYDYYRERHLTLIMERYAGAVERFELRRPVAAEGAPPPAYVAAVNIWIRDQAAFDAAGAEHGAEVAGDVPNFTNALLLAQNETVWGEAGAGLHEVDEAQTCLTIIYPYQKGASWDADYYRDHHMPLIMDLYGREAIRRFEVRRPIAPESGNPAFLGTVNIYVEDQQAFDAAGAEHTQTLVDDVPNFASMMPIALPTRIQGVGRT